MKDFVKKSAVKVKNHVQSHKLAYTVTVTSAFWMTMAMYRVNNWNAFLEEKGLKDEFYYMGEFEEIAPQ